MSWKTAYRSIYYDGAPEPEDLLLPKDEEPSQLVAALAPIGDEITVTKTTDELIAMMKLKG